MPANTHLSGRCATPPQETLSNFELAQFREWTAQARQRLAWDEPIGRDGR